MDGYLKQSTASQTRWIGPFLDDTDFKTAETGLTVANTDIKVSKNGGASASKNSGGGTHDTQGMYAVTWDATDTATVGQLAYSIKVAGALPVFGTYIVVEEAVYDALFAASAPGYVTDQAVNVTKISGASVSASTAQLGVNVVNLGGSAVDATSGLINANVKQISTDATAADNAESFFDGTGYAGTNNVIPTVSDVTTKTGYRLSSTGVDDVLRTALTESYASDGAAGTLSQILFGLQAFLQERSVSGTTLTVKKLDGSTTAMTFTLNDGTSPTSLTRAS